MYFPSPGNSVPLINSVRWKGCRLGFWWLTPLLSRWQETMLVLERLVRLEVSISRCRNTSWMSWGRSKVLTQFQISSELCHNNYANSSWCKLAHHPSCYNQVRGPQSYPVLQALRHDFISPFQRWMWKLGNIEQTELGFATRTSYLRNWCR